jgi:hypothetical protein
VYQWERQFFRLRISLGTIIARMISRRTIVFFVLSAALCGVLAYQAREEQRPCREFRQKHPNYIDPPAQRQPDGTYTVSFNTCDFLIEPTAFEKVVALSAFVTVVAFCAMLAVDIGRGVKRRLRRKA